jgi:putative membrane protein
MNIDIIVKYFHFIGIFGMVSALFAEQILVKKEVSRAVIKKLARIDLMYGMSALVALATGLLQWFVVGRAAELFSRNWIFHTKLTLFVGALILSIIPTIYFIKNRKGGSDDDILKVPAKVKVIIMLEMIAIFIIPLLAILMSRGVGTF